LIPKRVNNNSLFGSKSPLLKKKTQARGSLSLAEWSCRMNTPALTGHAAAAFELHWRGTKLSHCLFILGAEASQVAAVTSSREKQSVHYVPAKITCSLLKPAHALASQHLRTLDA
jgi:hypothetical protein